jgi:hypothetical protein
MTKLTRECYLPTKEATTDTIERDGLNGIVYCYNDHKNRPCARAFKGRASKPYFAYYFLREEDRKNRINDFFEMLQKAVDRKEEAKLEKKKAREEAKKSWKVGQILYDSWGYEQTQCDFYQVTEVKGLKIKIRPICSKTVDGSQGHDCCRVVPVKDSFIEGKEEIIKIVNNPNSIRMNSFSSAYKTTETESHHVSWYY